MNPNPTHEILVCEDCGHRPTACRCGYKLQGIHQGSVYARARKIRERGTLKQRVLTRRGVDQLVDLLLEACETLGPEEVRRRVKTDDPIGDATDRADLNLVRRYLYGEPRSPRRALSGRA